MPRPRKSVSPKQLAANRANAAGNPFPYMPEELTGDLDIIRYQAQAERHYRRALEEFERLKALRQELPDEPISAPQPEPKATTCTPRPTNRFPPRNQFLFR